MSEYFTSDFDSVSEDTLCHADRDIQLDVMETWFRQHFEDPANDTPYESAEGGYIWINGGPHYAREELKTEFFGVVPDEVINELAAKLEWECADWAPISSAEDYDDFFVEDIARITEYYQNFSGAILSIGKLLRTKVDDTVANCFWRLLYVNAITALETYLSDAFINSVVTNPNLMRLFIETTPKFQSEKVSLSDVYKAIEEIKQKARSYLIDVVWHHLERIKPMYNATLNITFPDDLGAISRAILTRHHIVHRNGKTKDGKEILISQKDIRDLIDEVEKFVQHIDMQLAEMRANNQLNTDVPPSDRENEIVGKCPF